MKSFIDFILVLLSLIISQFLMYYFIDDIIAKFAAASMTYLAGRLLLACAVFTAFKFFRRDITVDSTVSTVGIGMYILFLILITFFKASSPNYAYNFVPLNFLEYFSEVNTDVFVFAICINLLMFVPVGVFMRITNIRFSYAALSIFVSSLTIEVTQFVTRRGSFDVDDLLLNTLGGLAGYLITGLIFSRIMTKRKISPSLIQTRKH